MTASPCCCSATRRSLGLALRKVGSPTRTWPCTLNTVPAPARVRAWRCEGLPGPCPTTLWCVEEPTVPNPHLTLGRERLAARHAARRDGAAWCRFRRRVRVLCLSDESAARTLLLRIRRHGRAVRLERQPALDAEHSILAFQPALERTRTPLYSTVFRCMHCLSVARSAQCSEFTAQYRLPAPR